MLSALLAMAVLHTTEAARLDAEVSAFLAPYRVCWLLAAFLWLTTLGTGAALVGIVVTATGFLWADDQRARLILPLWVAFAGAQATVWIGKYVVGRARPVFLEGVAAAASPSFPSAHTTGAVRRSASSPTRWPVTFPSGAAASRSRSGPPSWSR